MRTLKTTQKEQVRIYTRRAIASGKLERLPCEVCGELKTEPHHEDYKKPLEVMWLCDKHHHARHTELRKKGASIPKNKKLMTPRQVAEMLQVTPRTVTKWCREGHIKPCWKIGRVWRIEQDFEVKGWQ